ncbi:selenocysteine-specific translation elongation factor [Anaerobacillus alkalidiazotrophicus]|uniref:Selenocysteine-specific elongation factor n=1 Tax=Anaerobacillus alkalidiazotrophicus TaxID=472963 RepID=A0A1S2M5U4_9BACI|nr:selenocysteine-specific translation elongation factor [Anaerobacillus alkalidiazotrophicus]OIJ19005.1 selenocysteine-specific translation elongation factor [Anaerobacillus alkalidiazotrophicus]
MGDRFYTIGMAGHIDHGKTTLTKALTNIDTDRLKEEKERSISIELGFAPLKFKSDIQVSVIDVPGHERFIRQMIAGVAGIDLVMLIVSADEGVMPQTKEHLDILSLLGIQRGIVVVTKVDRVDEELLELAREDIAQEIEGTFLEGAPFAFVDSLSGKGIDDLKDMIEGMLSEVPSRDAKGAFRLPIDQVFTVHGQGTVVRGTIYEGSIQEGDILEVLPQKVKVRARQLQVHHQKKERGFAGQRTAINLGGIAKEEVKRGDVLVSTQQYATTSTIDVSLQTLKGLNYPLKQRGYIKLHLGTAEVYGKIVFFDRNQLDGKDEDTILCQLRLDEPIVTRRGDRFILRRPTPVETIGGGLVIDPNGQKYKFGESTIELLERKREGTPTERVIDALKTEKFLTLPQLQKHVDLQEDMVMASLNELIANQEIIQTDQSEYVLSAVYEEIVDLIKGDLEEFHEEFSLREGKSKAEVFHSLKQNYPMKLLEFSLSLAQKEGKIIKRGQFIALGSFDPHFPKKWTKRMEQVVKEIDANGIQVEGWDHIVSRSQLPSQLQEDLRHYLIRTKQAFALDEKHMVSSTQLISAITKLRKNTKDEFELQDAKEVLKLSRKYLVPFMELLDTLKLTVRNETKRQWQKAEYEKWMNQK